MNNMMTPLVTALALLILAPSGGWALTPNEISQFQARDVTEKNTGKKGSVSLTVEGDNLRLVSNGIPDHATGDFPGQSNPNNVKVQDNNLLIPNNPKIADEPICLPMGPIGYVKNGVAIYNPYNADAKNAVEGDFKETFDLCEGHPSPDGQYHYHHTPSCLDLDVGNDVLVGIAIDGFPIYGPKDSSGKTLTSAELDDCNGHTVDGKYRYRLNTEFPYILGCFKGEVTLTERQKRHCYLVSAGGSNGSGSIGAEVSTSFIVRVSLIIFTAMLLNLTY